MNYNRLVHLDVEDCSEELLRQQSYAMKNQLGHPKPPTRGFGTQNILKVFYLLLGGSLWQHIPLVSSKSRWTSLPGTADCIAGIIVVAILCLHTEELHQATSGERSVSNGGLS